MSDKLVIYTWELDFQYLNRLALLTVGEKTPIKIDISVNEIECECEQRQFY